MPDTDPPGPAADDDLVELAYPYALDAVSDSERDEIDERVAAAAPETGRAFGEIVREVRETMGVLSALDAQAAPPEVEARIMARLDEAAKDAPTPLTRARRRPPLRWLAAAAAAIIAAVVGVGVATDWGRDERTPPIAERILQQPDTRTATAELSTGGSMTAHASAELGAATVAFEAVPAPPAGRVYQLWLVPPDGQPRSAGVLTQLPSPTAPLVTTFAPDDKLAISIEPDGGSPTPTTTPLGAVAFD
ncbi:anti-sigma factor [Nocardia thraciensis]